MYALHSLQIFVFNFQQIVIQIFPNKFKPTNVYTHNIGDKLQTVQHPTSIKFLFVYLYLYLGLIKCNFWVMGTIAQRCNTLLLSLHYYALKTLNIIFVFWCFIDERVGKYCAKRTKY